MQAQARRAGLAQGVSIRTRHRCRVMPQRGKDEAGRAMFQSAPGIAAG